MSEIGGGGDLSSRRVIDVAIGVLIGWRGCSEREAFDELVGAVRETGIGIGSLARAVVALGSGEVSSPHRAEALRMWDDVVPVRAASTSTAAQ